MRKTVYNMSRRQWADYYIARFNRFALYNRSRLESVATMAVWYLLMAEAQDSGDF